MAAAVSVLLERKNQTIFSVSPESSIYEAGRIMAEKKIGVVVVLEGKRVAGILSERDIVRKVVIEEQCTKECPVGEIMTEEVVNVAPNDTIEQCMAIMTEKKFRHLTVMENGELVGIISIGDLVKFIIDEKDTTIRQYQKYIYDEW